MDLKHGRLMKENVEENRFDVESSRGRQREKKITDGLVSWLGSETTKELLTATHNRGVRRDIYYANVAQEGNSDDCYCIMRKNAFFLALMFAKLRTTS